MKEADNKYHCSCAVGYRLAEDTKKCEKGEINYENSNDQETVHKIVLYFDL